MADGPSARGCLQGEYLLEVCRPFEVRVHRCSVAGQLTPQGRPSLSLTPLRALSLLTLRAPPVAMALVPPARGAAGAGYGDEKGANRDIRVWHGATGNGP